jgi:predicted ArsR family transcriptional regulator
MDLFPTRYFRFATRLLDEIKESMPEGKVQELFSGVANGMAEQYARTLEGLPLPERMQRLVEFLSEEGFDAQMERRGDQVYIRELSCPYFRLGRQHPEVCTVDQAFIATALTLPVERVTCLLNGDAHCTFAININQAAKEMAAHD